MPEMKNNFQKGRMNKDLDERLVSNGEYRDALNVEIATSNDSDTGTLQTLKGNTFLGVNGVEGVCIGSIADDKNDKLYFMVAGDDRDRIIEYDYKSKEFLPVCIDHHSSTGRRALNFNADFLITGINIIDDLLFWTDNNSEPKKINITRGKLGCLWGAFPYNVSYVNHTKLMVRNIAANAPVNSYVKALDQDGEDVKIQEEHLTVIKKGPSAAPVLEMIDTLAADSDGDGLVGGSEVSALISNASSLAFLDANGDFVDTHLNIQVSSGMDFPPGAFLNIYKTDDRSINVRVQIITISNPYPGSPTPPIPPSPPPYNSLFEVKILSGNKEIQGETEFTVELEQADALFQFKFPRFAYRYKYEDGEYSCFSPFTEPAFIPGRFNYLPKEGYNLGMVNRLRRLAIKDFVHERSIADDVISIDILYKESNSPNIYSVKTVKRVAWDAGVWDAWNGNSAATVADIGSPVDEGWRGITKGYLPITTEMIHATLPANQLLRPWDNVPRKALAQEVIGNRLVYGNYLQNYDLKKTIGVFGPNNIKVDVEIRVNSEEMGNVAPEELHAGNKRFMDYKPTKSVKTLRTYQVGVVYIDKYGRETPVFSEDKRGAVSSESTSESSVYIKKTEADKRNQLIVKMNSNPPEWATHRKYFIKETSNEYYNLAMDRCYDAEDGNVWLSFPSAERNKVDEETFLILKKAHDSGELVLEPAKYKIIAIENEAPRFIKLKNISMGAIQDTGDPDPLIGTATGGFPFEGGFHILMEAAAFVLAGWNEKLINQNVSQVFVRAKANGAVSHWYRVKQVLLTVSSAHYKIEVDKQFGSDMDITSAISGDWTTRFQNCTIEIVKRIPEDRAEFEGRFFVKILKDATIIKTVCPDISLDANWVPTAQVKVQYIDPRALEDNGGGYIHNQQGSWFGQDKYLLSVDEKNDEWKTSNSYNTNKGNGEAYWSRASRDTSANALSITKSSGWFIDKVEAFRPYQGNVNEQTTDIGIAWNSYGGNACTSPFTSPAINWKPLNALGLNTYGDFSPGNYLGYSNTREPSNSSGSLIRQADASKGGKVAPSIGIDVASGIINLSYSGLNVNAESRTNYTTGTLGDVYAESSFTVGAKHAGDEAFISKLLTPGTIWRWKEDPGTYDSTSSTWKPVLYKTVLNTDFSTGPYTQAEWDKETLGDLDAANDFNKGVYLFNYAMFADYLIDNHHRHEFHWGTLVSNTIWPYWKADFASRDIPTHKTCCGDPLICLTVGACGCDCYLGGAPLVTTGIIAAAGGIIAGICSPVYHNISAAKKHGAPSAFWGDSHYRFPTGIYHWDHQINKRRRFVFKAEPLDHPTLGLGQVGPHNYLPTNDPSLPSHFDATATPITAYPTGTALAGTTFASQNLVAPGIRNDGMHAGYDHPGGYSWDPDGNGAQTYEEIPLLKRWSAAGIPTDPAMAGSVTWQIMEPFTETDDKIASKNPAVWETEPKEDVGLDIYHEVGQIYPNDLNDETIEQFVGAISADINKNSYVQCWHPTGGHINLETGPGETDVRILAAYDRYVMLGSATAGSPFGLPLEESDPTAPNGHITPTIGSYLMIWRADGSETEAFVKSITPANLPINASWYELGGKLGEFGVHNEEVRLPWFNCYSFGNGVESDRIRDDYNQVTIDNGPKASTTLEEPYLEERRKNGFIWSGLYNSISGVNDTNQFIQAEKITKDVNPSYGSIQKLFARDSDLIAFCEDRVLRVLANKDALYNADGNTNLVSTDRVLGNVRPFVGDYGISLNPESFASDSYRSYFSDSSRGAILRLSQDGLTPISDFGMHDWFADKLALIGDNKIIGSFDDNKGEYNITLKSLLTPSGGYDPGPSSGSSSTSGAKLGIAQPSYTATTLSFSEVSKGWVSFKSWNQENGISLNNSYYTFSGGQMFQHHTNETRNNFYWPGSPALLEDYQYESSVDVLFNQAPSSIKSFSTLNYEGSQARITPEINDNPDYYDNFSKDGWYVREMVSNAQELGEMEFWDKEDKWFSQIKGVKTEWLDDGTAGNIDPREFSYQGIGNASDVSCPDCPEVTSWNCNRTGEGGFNPCSCQQIIGNGGTYTTEQDCLNNTNDCCGSEGEILESWDCYDGNCIDPGTGLGQYSTLAACQSICEVAPLIYGCTDSLACNYYAAANMDDGSCYYPTWDCTNGVCIEQNPCLGTGTYNSWSACDAACVTSSPDNWLCHAGGCTPTSVPVNTIAGIFATLSVCQTACGYSPCADFTTSNYTLEQNPSNWECSNAYISWSVNIPNFQPGDTWVHEISSDSTGTIVSQSNNPSSSSSGGGTAGGGLFTAGNYTMEITHTLASGEVCTYTFPIIISCIG